MKSVCVARVVPSIEGEILSKRVRPRWYLKVSFSRWRPYLSCGRHRSLVTPIILPYCFIGIIWELLDQMNGWCLDFSQMLRRELRLGSITIMMGEWQFCLPLQYQHGTASPMQNVQNINLISTQFPDKRSWWKTVIDSLFPQKRWGKFSMTSLATNTWNRNKVYIYIYIIIHGPPKPTCLEVFMANHMVFRWPKLFFLVLGAKMVVMIYFPVLEGLQEAHFFKAIFRTNRWKTSLCLKTFRGLQRLLEIMSLVRRR